VLVFQSGVNWRDLVQKSVVTLHRVKQQSQQLWITGMVFGTSTHSALARLLDKADNIELLQKWSHDQRKWQRSVVGSDGGPMQFF